MIQPVMNMIRVDEGGRSKQYIICKGTGMNPPKFVPDGFTTVREQRGQETFFHICMPAIDVEWSEISDTPSEETPKGTVNHDKTTHENPAEPLGSQVDAKV